MKHKSHIVHLSTTSLKPELGTVSRPPEGELSINSKSLGKLSHKLKHNLHPLQISKTLRISWKSGKLYTVVHRYTLSISLGS